MIKLSHWSIYSESELELESSSNSAYINLDIFFLILYLHSSKLTCGLFSLSIFITESILTQAIQAWCTPSFNPKVCINYTIKLFYFSLYLFFIINRHAMKVYAFNFFNFVPNLNLCYQFAIIFNHKGRIFSSVIKTFYVSTYLR